MRRRSSITGKPIEAPPLMDSLNNSLGRSTVLLIINLIILVALVSLLYMLATLYLDQAALMRAQSLKADSD